MSEFVKRLREVLSHAVRSGVASPGSQTVYDTAEIPLADVWELYKRDTACGSSVDLLAASVKKRFYTTCTTKDKYSDAEKAKDAVDDFNKTVNLDRLLWQMSKRLVACGNDFWAKLSPEQVFRLPLNAVEKIEVAIVEAESARIPFEVTGYKLRANYGGGVLEPEKVIHWKLDDDDSPFGFGVGLLQRLLHTLTIKGTEKRPAYAAMKAKIEAIMPGIFEKYAGPDVLANVPGATDETIKKFEKAIKERTKEGTWLFYNGKDKNGGPNVSINPVQIDPRARFDGYIEHMVNQFYLGCETPLPRLFSTPGFTEASAKAALELQDMLIDPVQLDIKRRVEMVLFDPVVVRAGFDAVKAAVRLNWGNPKTPELKASDLIAAATATPPLIRPEEFRKNATKILGWELWDEEPQPGANVSQEASK